RGRRFGHGAAEPARADNPPPRGAWKSGFFISIYRRRFSKRVGAPRYLGAPRRKGETMDERDCRILMALVRSPFESYESLGREIGTSGTAVRARLDRLARAGVFLGFACGPSAIALRRHARLAVYAPGVDDVDAR